MNPRATAVVFDLDDTLFREIDFLHSAYRQIAADLSCRYPALVSSVEAERVLFEAEGNAFDALRQWLPAEVAEDQLWMRDFYRAHTPSISLMPGATTMLDALADAGYTLGIITDGRIVTQTNKILALGLHHWFRTSDIIISEALKADKLTDTPFRTLMERHPEIERWIYVGDNPAKDILWPRRLGWTTVQLKATPLNIHPQPPHPAPDLRIDSLADLFSAVG